MANKKHNINTLLRCFCVSLLLSFILCKQCHKGKKKMAPKIVNGVPVNIESFPHMVGIHNRRSLCGGSILNTYSVLTAAHCFDNNLDPKNVTVYSGSNYYRKQSDRYKAHGIILHKNYNKQSLINDIAVVFLKIPIKFSNKSKKALLVGDEKWMQEVNARVHVVGWGTTWYRGKLAKTLMKVTLNYVETGICSKKLNRKIDSTAFCLYAEGKDSCQGDSGGGVIWNGTLVGVVSYGTRCAVKDRPAVYTNVYAYINWIKETVDNYFKINCAIYQQIIKR